LMEEQTNVGRNAVDKMGELQDIGGLQSWELKRLIQRKN
jgi:hypothetical protein